MDEPWKEHAHEKLKRYLMPGCWEDTDGAVHFSIPEIHEHFGIPNTQEGIDETALIMTQVFDYWLKGSPRKIVQGAERMLREKLGSEAKINMRKTPNEGGEYADNDRP